MVTIGAGEGWDDVVAELTEQGFGELATLSGIPGSTGATPVQNVGAYGTEIAEVLQSVTLYDRGSGRSRRVDGRRPEARLPQLDRCAAPTAR